MVLKHSPEFVAIRHSIVGFESDVIDMGRAFSIFSIELALWLEATRLNQLSNHPFPSYWTATPPNWIIRAKDAAIKSYHPPFRNPDSTLTETGLIYGKISHDLLDLIREQQFDLTDIVNLTSAEDMFFTADFSKRQIKLLTVVDRGIRDALAEHKTGADEIFKSFKADRERNKPDKPEGIRMVTRDEQEVDGYNKEDLATEFLEVENKTICLVRTANFNAKAKYDLKVLIKAGLVDYRLLYDGSAGRPKAAIMVSDLGTRFLKDLENRHVL